MLIAIRGDLKASQALAAVSINEEEEETSASASTEKNEKVPTG